MRFIDRSAMDAASYILILYSVSFIIFLFSNMLIQLYNHLAGPAPDYRYISSGHALGECRLQAAEESKLDGSVRDNERKAG